VITFIVRLRAEAGRGDEVESELATMARAVHASEPGCLAYFVHRSAAEPDLFVIYEQYEDESALELHRSSEHFRTHVEASVVPLLSERSREDLVLVAD
jgi:quinol monooxygenase YgiN